MNAKVFGDWLIHVLLSGPSIVEQWQLVREIFNDLIERFQNPMEVSHKAEIEFAAFMSDKHQVIDALTTGFTHPELVFEASEGRFSTIVQLFRFLRENQELIAETIATVQIFIDLIRGEVKTELKEQS